MKIRLSSDMYGNFYFFLQSRLRDVHAKIRTAHVNFMVTSILAQDLHSYYKDILFDRVDVSELTDRSYLGIDRTLHAVQPLLNHENKHSTVVSFSMAAVREMIAGDPDKAWLHRNLKLAEKYMGYKLKSTSSVDMAGSNMFIAANPFHSVEELFAKVLRTQRTIHKKGRIVMKESHTIVPKWPYRMTIPFGKPGAQEEFDELLESGHHAGERYIEWRLI